MQGSHVSQLIQAADLVAYSAFQHLARRPDRDVLWNWYEQHIKPLVRPAWWMACSGSRPARDDQRPPPRRAPEKSRTWCPLSTARPCTGRLSARTPTESRNPGPRPTQYASRF